MSEDRLEEFTALRKARVYMHHHGLYLYSIVSSHTERNMAIRGLVLALFKLEIL